MTGLAVGGDDIGSPDDEDGVTLSALVRGRNAYATITFNASGMLDAWIDFNGDGDWNDAGERIADRLSLATSPHLLTIPVPATVTTGTRFARFRFSKDGVTGPGDEAPEGEVEDYLVQLVASPFIGLPDSYSTRANVTEIHLPFTLTGFELLPAAPVQTLSATAGLFSASPCAGFCVSPDTRLVLSLNTGIEGTADLLIKVRAIANPADIIEVPFRLSVWNALDADGISDLEERGVPHPSGGPLGDGNGDGIQDDTQAHVASLLATDSTYVTVALPASPPGLRLTEVSKQTPPPGAPVLFPRGLIRFRVEGLTPGQPVAVTQTFHGGLAGVTSYYKYGRSLPGATPDYYLFAYAGATGAQFVPPKKIILQLRDGALGDDDWSANGVIVDPSGPAMALPPAVALSISTLPGNQAQISWPASATGLVLKYADSLTAPVTWNNDTNVVNTAAGTNSVTVDISSGTRFYGLGQP